MNQPCAHGGRICDESAPLASAPEAASASLSATGSEQSRRVAAHHGEGRGIARDHGASANHRAVADSATWQKDRARSDASAVFNGRGC
ncbi:MAG TPA: hypothetical protein VN845_04785, partial [Solirubrobacteraceae bacterium]|nr:hypothetical protein [Solirubrobacteraceae bacterium]